MDCEPGNVSGLGIEGVKRFSRFFITRILLLLQENCLFKDDSHSILFFSPRCHQREGQKDFASMNDQVGSKKLKKLFYAG